MHLLGTEALPLSSRRLHPQSIRDALGTEPPARLLVARLLAARLLAARLLAARLLAARPGGRDTIIV